IVEDPVITRGGCRISSASSQVDATVETRLARVINSILGDDRDSDATND
ncbi:MAG: flagellar assembly protein FliH, partial [Gammaproteobacteria bacterium]|nr:flagellar assembly protein FliH [Gammaproteobacteria bacterium]